jgi:hypothetical protein
MPLCSTAVSISQITSVETGDYIPPSVAMKPLSPTKANGIDFIYVQQNSSLSCHIRFSKITVDNADVATSRIPLAENL